MKRQRIALATMTAWLLVVVLSAPVLAETKHVMVFGDSNSWGWKPIEAVIPTDRYAADVRWPGVMAAALGDGYSVVEEALPGRTTAFDDSSIPIGGAGMNGLKYLPAAIGSHLPLDLVVIMLGTNDTKAPLGKTTLDIAVGALQLAAHVRTNTGVFSTYPPAKVLIIAPPPLGTMPHDWVAEIFNDDSIRKSKELAGVLGPLADAAGVPFFNAGSVATLDGVDGIHMSPEAHAAIGAAVAAEVRALLE